MVEKYARRAFEVVPLRIRDGTKSRAVLVGLEPLLWEEFGGGMGQEGWDNNGTVRECDIRAC